MSHRDPAFGPMCQARHCAILQVLEIPQPARHAPFVAPRTEILIAVAAAVAATVTAWVTLNADFLAHPGWLALEKADLILGPVLVGLYWLRRRPTSRFGLLLIAVGFACAPYILQSVQAPVPFAIGVLSEGLVGFGCVALILTFPSGRVDGRIAGALLAMEAVALLVAPTVALLTLPSIGGDGTISGCEARCPANGLFVASIPAFASTLIKADRSLIIAIAFATLGLIGWRVATGTPPRRRAFFIGAPLAVCFELLRAGYHSLFLLSPEPSRLQTYVNWTFALARSTLCYGFLLALVAAELFAGRVLRRLVAELLRRPSLDQLEAMLREPLGDPGLRLGFWDPRTRALVDARGEALTAPEPPSGQVRTVIERDRGRAAVLFHDAQLTDDPELLQAAGTVALLALENLDLEAAWTEALRELQRSRARISAAGDVERRKLERDLHDGAQQRLVAALIKLGEVRGGVDDPAARSELATLVAELERTLLELRELAHGIYPPVLADAGLVPALRATDHTGDLTVIAGSEVGRYGSAIESAVYFCCLEAIQNATKHSGAAADIVIRLSEGAEGLRFDVQDAGPGFDPSTTRPGIGIRNMRDRLEAVGGSLEIVSSLGRGTVVTGTVPLGRFVSDPHPAPRVTEVP